MRGIFLENLPYYINFRHVGNQAEGANRVVAFPPRAELREQGDSYPGYKAWINDA